MFEMIRAAKIDPYVACQCLQIFVKRLREKSVVDDELTRHVIGALEAAIAAPASTRGKVLSGALYLTTRDFKGRGGKRKRADYLTVGTEMKFLMSSGFSKTKATAKLAKKWGIDPRTVGRHFDRYEAAQEVHDKVASE